MSLSLVACGGQDVSRSVVSLNGNWQVAQGGLTDTPPASFEGTVPVPGLVTSATPPYADVGLESPEREAFWYKTTFDGPAVASPPGRAQLVIKKAKYGIAVWLNDVSLGEHFGSYTKAIFDVSGALVSGETNTLLVRVGAHRSAVRRLFPAAQDAEKTRWIPGIYDDVELVLSGTPHIVRTKVEPDIGASTVVVKTTIANTSGDDVSVEVTQAIIAGVDVATDVDVPAGGEVTVSQTVPHPGASLWTPEQPTLYSVQTTLRSGHRTDDLETRFGMRIVEFRGAPNYGGRFYLNDSQYYLRGSNITLHRFFEDPNAGQLAWDETWVRKLFGAIPKSLGWNTFRISVGRAPDFWYDIADEQGFLLADEFQMWTVIDESAESWDIREMEREYTSWVQDNWNHPSIAWWDASNETRDEKSTEVIKRVRGLDSTRQWENGAYNAPESPNDPIEDHPYFYTVLGGSSEGLKILDGNDGQPPQGSAGIVRTFDAPMHPYINNEYAWLWIDRQGQPTKLTRAPYRALLGGDGFGPEVYREAYAYLTAGLTEFWRARRGYAGILHFAYLSYSRPDGETSDNFLDVELQTMEPRWRAYATDAFAPVMVYVDSWRDDYAPGQSAQIPLVVINDHATSRSGQIWIMAIADDGTPLATTAPTTVTIGGNSKAELTHAFDAPMAPKYLLVAELTLDDGVVVRSKRKVGYAHPGEAPPPLP